jgi:hypothetical protein
MRRASIAARLAPALALTACAGGAPLLHPARTLGKGEVRAAAGLSGQAVAGDFASALRNARNEAGTSPTQPADAPYAKGALVAAAVNPGLAPYVAARVGVGHELEAGLTYTGRGARVDLRRSFSFGPDDAYAVSIGVGGSAALYGRLEGASLPGVNLSDLRGWGADVPLLVGYEAQGGLYMVWLGARGGWEHDTIAALTTEPKPVSLGFPPIGLSADRFWGGPVLGAAAGFRHVHVAVEVDASYQTVSGSFGGSSASVSGVSIVPASAIWWDF